MLKALVYLGYVPEKLNSIPGEVRSFIEDRILEDKITRKPSPAEKETKVRRKKATLMKGPPGVTTVERRERAGDPLYEAVSHLGRLLRTVFLCDYFLNDMFRRELLRVLNRGEAVMP